MNKILATISALLLVVLIGGAAYYFMVMQPHVTSLDAVFRRVNEVLTTTTAENATIKQQIAQLTCKGKWDNGACTPYTATMIASPESGTSTLKVSFTISVPEVNYNIDFGDGSSSTISSLIKAQNVGNCGTDQKPGLCTVSLFHSYSAKTADATFAAKLLKDGNPVSSATITVRKK